MPRWFLCPELYGSTIESRVIPPCYQQFFRYQYFTGSIRFLENSIFQSVSNFWREPLFPEKGAGSSHQKRGAAAPLLRKKGLLFEDKPIYEKRGSRQNYDTESTDRVFLRFGIGKYQEILTDTDQKIVPIRYLLIVTERLTVLSKRICPEHCFFFGRSTSSACTYVRTLYPEASQYIAN